MKAEYKIPGGKLLVCTIETRNNIITELKISGDFFMHPEAAIIDLEAAVLGSNTSEYGEKINDFFKDNEITLFGISENDFTEVIRLALDS